jgi:hypothetical protein
MLNEKKCKRILQHWALRKAYLSKILTKTKNIHIKGCLTQLTNYMLR